MFWIAILSAALAAILFKLGALSVLNVVLSTSLTAALLVIACLVIFLLWRHFFRRGVRTRL